LRQPKPNLEHEGPRYKKEYAKIHKHGLVARQDLQKGDLIAAVTIHYVNRNSVFFRLAPEPIEISKPSELTIFIKTVRVRDGPK
jgi:hypothetical protein